MAYDKKSFLSGLAAGRNMESWPAFEGGKYQGMLLVTMHVTEDPWYYPTGMLGIDPGGICFSTEPNVNGWTESVTIHIDWGDGTTQDVTLSSWALGVSHSFPGPGYYDVIAYGLPVPTCSSKNAWRFGPGIINGPLPGPWKDSNMSTMFLEGLSENAFDWYKKHSDQYQWRADYFNEFFEDCISLKKVPGGLFDGIAFYTYENHPLRINNLFHNCQALEEVGAGFFSNPAFREVAGGAIFPGCASLKSVPDDIFKNLVGAESFGGCFNGCGLTSFPSRVFENCSLVVSMNSAFANCPDLASIPTDIFYGLDAVTNYGSCFQNSGLRTVPGDIFQYSPDAEDFRYCFADCEDLTDVPSSILDSITTTKPNLEAMFWGCKNLRHAPELWLKFPNAPHYRCFQACPNVDNKAEIPSGWK